MSDQDQRAGFLGLTRKERDYDTSRVVVVPVPYEATVSYGRGTALGPQAIIEASAQVELYDEELGFEPFRVGVATHDPLDVASASPSELKGRIVPAVDRILEQGKVPLLLGGEHSITPAAFVAVHRRFPDTTVVQLDAHADLRQEYEGEPMSHACAMARIREMAPAVQVGIRNLSAEEASWVKRDGLALYYAHEMHGNSGWMQSALDRVKTPNVYVTIDLDAFDSALMPSTGTPEPGGMDWYQATNFLRLVMRSKRVVGLDIVELAPRENLHAPDFMAAKLAYKCIGYMKEGGGL